MDSGTRKASNMKTKPRVEVKPVMVSHDVAAAMLAGISPRTLDKYRREGLISARRITEGKKGRVGYLVRELEQFAEALPLVVPGVE